MQGDPDEEFFVPLDFEWALWEENQWEDRAVSALEINSRLGAGHRFRHTVFTVSEEMAEVIEQIVEEKCEAARHQGVDP